MTTTRCSATIILVLWYSAQVGWGAARPRAAAARKAQPAKRGIRPTVSGDLGRLAAGIRAFEQGGYTAAVTALALAPQALPKLADYVAYYRAAARLESGDASVSAVDLAAAYRNDVASPLAGRARVIEARSRTAAGAPAEAVRLLRGHYGELPQPEGDLALAAAYETSRELAHAAEFYQRVYHQFPASDAAMRAGAALRGIQESMGASYPAPLARQVLDRVDRLVRAGAYPQARADLRALAAQVSGIEGEIARVRLGAVDYRAGNTRSAYVYLRQIEPSGSEAGAERLYYLAECARRLDDEAAMLRAVDELAERHPRSPWRLEALLAAGNRFLLNNQPERYVPLYRAAFESFPGDPAAVMPHWKVAFRTWLEREAGAQDLLRSHVRNYPGHHTAAGALYFLGRSEERQGDAGSARAIYEKLVAVYPNYYYGVLGLRRLADAAVAAATPSARAVQFLSGVAFPPRPAPELEPTPQTALRVERAWLLRTAGLEELSEEELRFGMEHDGRPHLLAMELARRTGTTHEGLRVMKRYCGDYLGVSLDRASNEYWKLLFPMPWRGEIGAFARAAGLDPYLVAALIRQESEFNPAAVSRAAAYGLMQVRPPTARQYARRAGLRRVPAAALKDARTNLQLGTTILRSMLDAAGGKLEQALAAYNAGPARVARWLGWRTYEDPAEFVESIPLTETRDYVQAVIRNIEVYRRLYGGDAAGTRDLAARKIP